MGKGNEERASGKRKPKGKGRSLFLFLLCAALLVLSACEKGGDAESFSDAAEEEQKEDSQNTALTEILGETEEDDDARELSNQELRKFTAWINQGDNYGNYGFLLSEYEKPEDVDLSQVLYSGGGMKCEPLSEAEKLAFLEATGEQEIYTDCTRLTSGQIEDYLIRKLGIYEESMLKSLEAGGWMYLPDFDIWVREHGDTNYMNFTCVSGRQTSVDTFELDCVPGDEDYGPYVSACILTVRKDGTFVSNVFTDTLTYSKAIWRIEDQSFDINLDGWGEVTFTSYEPDISVYGQRDATFGLVKDGKEIYSFPAVEKDNYRKNLDFDKVEAVGFRDFDGDGNEDVIIIVRYQAVIHSDEGSELREVRLYRNEPAKKEFVPAWDAMDYLNMNRQNRTIQEVMEHVGEALSGEA